MILLNDERELNERTLERWALAIREVAEQAWATHQERGKELDITPLHHRLDAEGLRHEINKKILRVKSHLASQGWHTDAKRLFKIREECIDIVNYATFLGAFTRLLEEETIAGAVPSTPQREGG